MPANTSKGYPYPLGTDRVMDGDDSIKNLATEVDNALGRAAAGNVAITISALTTVYTSAVTFPSGRFSNNNVFVTTNMTDSASPADFGYNGAPADKNGFQVRIRRYNGTVPYTAQINWHAIQV